MKDGKNKYDPKSEYQINFIKLASDNEQIKENRVNNEISFKNPKLNSIVDVNKDEIDAALRDSDYISIGKNLNKENVFKRSKLYNDDGSASTIVSPEFTNTTGDMQWNDANVKLTNAQFIHNDEIKS